MHKVALAALATLVGATLAVGVPISANATTVAASNSVAASSSSTTAQVPAALGRHSAHPYYPPTTPPTAPGFPPPFWRGGFWWFPFHFTPGTFHPGSIVHIIISGFGGFHFTAAFDAANAEGLTLGTASSDGSLSAQLKASGIGLAGQTLSVTVTDDTGYSSSGAVAVPAAKTAALTSSTSSTQPDDSSSPASPGGYLAIATVWGAAGVLALGAAFVAMRRVTRRPQLVEV